MNYQGDMMVKVKICGLRRICDVNWANAEKVDYAGLVFAGNKRRLTDEQAWYLRRYLSSDIPAVGVFVDDAVEHIAALVRRGTIQMVQLHGHEDDAYIGRLRSSFTVPIIKAFSIMSSRDVEEAQKSTADYILVDYGAGGTGQSFDWSLLSGLSRPYFLAGGLSPDNVAKAIELCPYAVDVSSGIETAGFKDQNKMKKFMAQVRLCNRR